MANLYTGQLDFTGYQTVTSLTSVTFTEGTTYTLQVQNGAYIREGEIGDGFLVVDEQPFQYTAGVDDLYIKKAHTNEVIVLNIAE